MSIDGIPFSPVVPASALPGEPASALPVVPASGMTGLHTVGS